MDFASNFAIFEESWVLLHAPKLGHGTDYFTSPPKEGMQWIFPAGKIRRLRSGANPRSWVPEASMLTPRPPKPLSLGIFDRKSVNEIFPYWSTKPKYVQSIKL
jgi:hypothetical protein